MKKKDDKKEDEELLSSVLEVGLTLFGKPDPVKVAERRKQMRILNNLEYPGESGFTKP